MINDNKMSVQTSNHGVRVARNFEGWGICKGERRGIKNRAMQGERQGEGG